MGGRLAKPVRPTKGRDSRPAAPESMASIMPASVAGGTNPFSLLKKRAPPLPADGKRPSSEHRNNVFQDLILIKKQRDFFGIVTSGLIWWRT